MTFMPYMIHFQKTKKNRLSQEGRKPISLPMARSGSGGDPSLSDVLDGRAEAVVTRHNDSKVMIDKVRTFTNNCLFQTVTVFFNTSRPPIASSNWDFTAGSNLFYGVKGA